MCIRDSLRTAKENMWRGLNYAYAGRKQKKRAFRSLWILRINACLLYTSDAADERSSVDLGGRRIIKKKKKRTLEGCTSSKAIGANKQENDRRVSGARIN